MVTVSPSMGGAAAPPLHGDSQGSTSRGLWKRDRWGVNGCGRHRGSPGVPDLPAGLLGALRGSWRCCRRHSSAGWHRRRLPCAAPCENPRLSPARLKTRPPDPRAVTRGSKTPTPPLAQALTNEGSLRIVLNRELAFQRNPALCWSYRVRTEQAAQPVKLGASIMGIAKPKRPTLVVHGIVQSVEPRTKKADGEVYRHDLTIESPDGGLLSVEVWERAGSSPDLPPVLAAVAIVAEVSESQQYGASLGFIRWVSPDDLDRIASSSGVSLASAK